MCMVAVRDKNNSVVCGRMLAGKFISVACTRKSPAPKYAHATVQHLSELPNKFNRHIKCAC